MFRGFPLYDVDDAPGVGAPEADGDEDGGSLSDHEAAFGAGATREPAEPVADAEPAAEPAAEPRERNADGTFTKPRHRAKSQQASAEDVPRISELTRKFREAEERATAAERRAEDAERRAASRRESDREPAPPAREPARLSGPKFPPFEEWSADPSNKDGDWYAYSDAREDFRYEQRRAAEKADESAAAEAHELREQARTYSEKIPAFVKTHPDFNDIVSGERASVSAVLERAVIAVGPEAAYYLATHDEERQALTEDTLVHPDNPAFKATVAAMRRYLSTLVASQRPSPSRAVAGSTGAARASLAPPAPRPPTLVRTGATRDVDDAPGDDSSLADHEKAFGPKRRRA